MSGRSRGASRVNLIVDETYRPADPARAAEVEECKRRNAEVCKLHSYAGPERPTFAALFRMAYAASERGELWAIANADVYFDNTIRKLRGVSLGVAVLAITRREGGELKANPWHSQDAWVFEPRPLAKAERWGQRVHPYGAVPAFELGRWACDNRLAFELAAAGAHVFNPCEDIHVHHLHTKREPNTAPWVPGPYVFVPPTRLSVALAMGKPQGPREGA